MIIDAHTHCFPDRLAERAIAKLAATSSIQPAADGTLKGLLQKMNEDGIAQAVICHIATNPRQQDSVNRFAVEINGFAGGRICSLGSVHPDSENIEETVASLKAAGLHGIKLHPDYMQTMVDDMRFDPIFGACEEMDMPVVIHAGYDPVSPELIHAAPARIAAVLDRHRKLKLVAAHMGACRQSSEVEKYLIGRDVYIDTSISLLEMEPEAAVRMLTHHAADRILFASDSPWSSALDTYRYLKGLALGAELEEKIFCQNARRLFSLPEPNPGHSVV